MELVKKCHENGSVWDNGEISIHHGDELKQGRKEQGVVVATEGRCSDLMQGGQPTDGTGCRPPAPMPHPARSPSPEFDEQSHSCRKLPSPPSGDVAKSHATA